MRSARALVGRMLSRRLRRLILVQMSRATAVGSHDGSNHIDPIRQVVLRGARRKMLGEDGAAGLDGSDEPVRDAVLADLCQQSVDRPLPDFLLDLRSDPVVGDDPRIMLGERDEDQHARAVLLSRHAADHELLHRRAVRLRPADPARHEPEAESRARGDDEKQREKHDLGEQDLPHGKIAEADEDPGDHQGEERRPGRRIAQIVGGGAGEHADDLAGGALLDGVDRGTDPVLVFHG